MKIKHHAYIIPVILILMLHLALRIHNSDVQPPYVDEGFHITRAVRVWDFAENPGRFSHGKVLLYFWMGLFEGNNTSLTILPVARMSVALFSMITVSMLYLFGRKFAGHSAGLLAMLLYTLSPLAIFYERMAMADPLASGLLALALWRCMIFVKRPTFQQGAIIGVLLGLTTLAKLTMGLSVGIPVLLALLYYRWRQKQMPTQLITLTKRYLPPLILSAIIVLLMWSPLLIPALAAHGSDDPFIIVNTTNITRNYDKGDPQNPIEYVERLLPQLADFVGDAGLLAVAGFALVGVLLIVIQRDMRKLRIFLILVMWFVVIALLSVIFTRFVTARYFQPLVAPCILMIAIVSAWLIETLPAKRLVTGCLAVLFGTYIAVWAAPFIQKNLTDVHLLDFDDINYTEYQAGYLIADEGIVAAAETLNTLPQKATYVTWNLCHLMFFHTEVPLNCLPKTTPRNTVTGAMEALQPGEPVYLIMTDYQPFWDRIDGAQWNEIAIHDRLRITRPVYVLEIWLERDD
ncbi:MAG: glycosyltransferase family 39 protein [Aggregatilineales bacterium]